MTDTMPPIERLQATHLHEGDVVVVTLPAGTPNDQFQTATDFFRGWADDAGVKVLVVTANVHLAIQRPFVRELLARADDHTRCAIGHDDHQDPDSQLIRDLADALRAADPALEPTDD
jgi:hypothetical protein